MKVEGKVVVVTGAAQGIGRALAERFHREGARGVVLADRNIAGVQDVARSMGAIGMGCDVSVEADLRHVIEETESRLGPIDLFCSNAGLADPDPDPSNLASAADAVWSRAWGVNVMAHVYAARLLVPRFVARGGGYFLNTVSAAGLLSQIGSALQSNDLAGAQQAFATLQQQASAAQQALAAQQGSAGQTSSHHGHHHHGGTTTSAVSGQGTLNVTA